MSKSYNQAVLSRAEVQGPVQQDLDLGINAIDTAVVRVPWSAGATSLRASKTVLDASVVRVPWSAGAMNLRATKTIVRVPWSAGAMDLRATKTIFTVG